MNRKWVVVAAAAGAFIMGTVSVTLSVAQEKKKESKLHRIMEKVNRNNSVIQKGTRNAVFYKKAERDIARSAKEMVKLAKEAKPLGKDSLEKAKVANPQKVWDDYSDAFIKSAEELEQLLSKVGAPYDKVKPAFGAVKKSCADCHKDFRVEDEF